MEGKLGGRERPTVRVEGSRREGESTECQLELKDLP